MSDYDGNPFNEHIVMQAAGKNYMMREILGAPLHFALQMEMLMLPEIKGVALSSSCAATSITCQGAMEGQTMMKELFLLCRCGGHFLQPLENMLLTRQSSRLEHGFELRDPSPGCESPDVQMSYPSACWFYPGSNPRLIFESWGS